MATLSERIQAGEIIIMDGGVSTEIQKRGVAMDKIVWSGIAHKTHPEIVRAVHEDYIKAGARVITTNTFSTARHVLENINLKGEVESINQEAVQVAKEARDNAATEEVWIAGSMSSMPPLNTLRDVVRQESVAASYQEQAEILAEMGVDLIVAEMMTDPINAALVIKAAVSTGLPVWVGFSVMSADEGLTIVSQRPEPQFDTRPPDDFEALVESTMAIGGQAAGVMHSNVDVTGPALDLLGKHWAGPKMAYAETGRFERPDWVFEQIILPDDYFTEVERWVTEKGVQIIGGCCGTGPEHIRALKKGLPQKLPQSDR